jgi:hypothetical protein
LKKKEVLIVTLMGIVTIAIILFGYKYSADRKEQLLLEGVQKNEQPAVQSSAEMDTSEAEKAAALEKTLQTFAENRGTASVVDYLQYIQYHNKQINVAFFGDIAEEASWAKTAMTDIQSAYALTMNLSYFSHSGESSAVYLNGGYSQPVAASNADVIFYVLPTKADQTADIARAQSTENIFKVYDEIKAASPNALIVLVTPPPAEAKMNVLNSRSLDYRDYATSLAEANQTYNVPFYDLHADTLQELENTGAAVSTIMDEAKLGLNESGATLFGTVFEKNLKTTTVNTTSGLYVEGEKPAMESIIKETVEENTVTQEPVYVEPVYEAPASSSESVYEAPTITAPAQDTTTYDTTATDSTTGTTGTTSGTTTQATTVVE